MNKLKVITYLLADADYLEGCAMAYHNIHDAPTAALYWQRAGEALEEAMRIACTPENDLPTCRV